METQNLSLPPADWPARPGNVPSLDGVRGCSILLVLVGHMLLPASLVGISAIGLKVFFVISGFLITRLLLAENKQSGHISLKNFYVRRLLRLYPVIIVYVLVTSVVLLLRGQHIPLVEPASVFFYFVNYLVVHYEHLGRSFTLPVGMLWSLSVEEHFYLFAPLALLLFRGHAPKVLAMALAICGISLGLRLLYAHEEPAIVDTLELYWRSETRFDSIAYGVILACLAEIPKGRQLIVRMTTVPLWLSAVVVMLATFFIRDAYFQNTWRFTVQGLALIPILAGVIYGSTVPLFNRLLNMPLLVWIGALSYSLYVWHGAIVFFFSSWFHTLPHVVVPWIEFTLSILFAIVSYYALERPIMRLRKRFGHRPAPFEVTSPSDRSSNVPIGAAGSPVK